MARPRPSAVTRLMENTDTSVTAVTSQSTKKAPRTASIPTPTGSRAATTPPKTTMSRIRVMGMAKPSARARSLSIVSPTWLKISTEPPTSTLTGPRSPAKASSSPSPATCHSSCSPARRPTTRAAEPSSLRSGGGEPRDQ